VLKLDHLDQNWIMVVYYNLSHPSDPSVFNINFTYLYIYC